MFSNNALISNTDYVTLSSPCNSGSSAVKRTRRPFLLSFVMMSDLLRFVNHFTATVAQKDVYRYEW